MCKCKIIVKILMVSLLSLSSIASIRSGDSVISGMKNQVKAINNSLVDTISAVEQGKPLDAAQLVGKVQDKSDDLGLNLDFRVDNRCAEDALLTLSGRCERTGIDICDVTITQEPTGERAISTHFNPNNDGCFKNSEDGSLCVAEPLESIFVMDGQEVRHGCEGDFKNGNSNIYKIKTLPSLHQKLNGPCGYYALFNLSKLYLGQTSAVELLDRNRFDRFFTQWKAHISYKEAISNYDIKSLIETQVSFLDKDNIAISCCNINHKHEFDELEVITFGCEDNSLAQRVQDFRVNGREQYLIIGTGKENGYIPGFNLSWDDFGGRCSCVPGHWIVLKIEWSGKVGNSSVIITVMDSSGPQDNRFAATIHWYYYMFAQKDANYGKIVDCIEQDDFFKEELSVQDVERKVKPEDQVVAGYDWEYLDSQDNCDYYDSNDYEKYDANTYDNYGKKDSGKTFFIKAVDEDLTDVLKDLPDRKLPSLDYFKF